MDTQLRSLDQKIEGLRRDLEVLFDEEKPFTHPDIIDASKKLDRSLNEYYRLLRKHFT